MMWNPPIQSWEGRLIELAREGLESQLQFEHAIHLEKELLEIAYQQCDEITRQNSRTFYLASGLLPAEKRHAVRALYAFCRLSDDHVDISEDNSHSKLDNWRFKVLYNSSHFSGSIEEERVAMAWLDTSRRFQIPPRYAEQLIDGVARDLKPVRYPTFDDLVSYCYGVASTVGLMAMHIIGFSGPEAIPYAVKLGVALQLTNILRDVGEDWRQGRLYLPLDELNQFGLQESDIDSGEISPRWQAFMQFQMDRTRQLYAEALPGISLLNPDGRFAIAAAAELYRAILDDIEAHAGQVFTRRAHVSGIDKLRRLPGIWWRSQA
jgi:phytoene synthase